MNEKELSGVMNLNLKYLKEIEKDMSEKMLKKNMI